MRSIACVLTIAMCGCAAAPNSTSEAPSTSRSSSSAATSHDIGGGATIKIPAGWTFNSYYMPPDLNATNIRITTHGIKMAITGILKSGPMRSSSELTDLLSKSTAGYVPLSIEKKFQSVNVDTPTSRLVYATFSAANQERGLPALANEHSIQVTSALLNKSDAVFTITISVNQSDSESSKNHLLSIEALKSVQ